MRRDVEAILEVHHRLLHGDVSSARALLYSLSPESLAKVSKIRDAWPALHQAEQIVYRISKDLGWRRG